MWSERRVGVRCIVWLGLFGKGLHLKFDSGGARNRVKIAIVLLADNADDTQSAQATCTQRREGSVGDTSSEGGIIRNHDRRVIFSAVLILSILYQRVC